MGRTDLGARINVLIGMLQRITVGKIVLEYPRDEKLGCVAAPGTAIDDLADLLRVNAQLRRHRQHFRNSRTVDIKQQLIDQLG